MKPFKCKYICGRTFKQDSQCFDHEQECEAGNFHEKKIDYEIFYQEYGFS